MGSKGRRIVVSAISVAAVLLVVVGVVFLVRVLAGSGEADPYTETEVSTQTSDDSDSSEPSKQDTTDEPAKEPEDATIDPAQVSTIDIEPLGVSVAYTKGVGGFTYEVVRTANGKQMVEFRNEELKGTKCTDDQGTFAAIAKDPTDAEQETMAKKVTVDGVTYGLSLSSATCTGNPELLAQYQESFSVPFSLLKKLTSTTSQ